MARRPGSCKMAQMNLADGVGCRFIWPVLHQIRARNELLELGKKKPRGAATHDASRAGLSKSAKTRRNVIAMDRALQRHYLQMS